MDGTWILLRGRNSGNQPMVPVVVSWRTGEGTALSYAWRDSASLRDMQRIIDDVPQGSSADWILAPL